MDDIFKNRYVSPRPQVTTLEIPVQGVGEWCHPLYTPTINDSVFRTLIERDQFTVRGVPFRTPKKGNNIAYASLWDRYPDAIDVALKPVAASSAYLLMAGSTTLTTASWWPPTWTALPTHCACATPRTGVP